MDGIEYVDLQISIPKGLLEFAKALAMFSLQESDVEAFLLKRLIDLFRADLDCLSGGYFGSESLIELYGLKEVFALVDC